MREKLESMVETHEKHKNSYFWTPPSNARARRSKEFTEYLEFEWEGRNVKWTQKLECSCKTFIGQIALE